MATMKAKIVVVMWTTTGIIGMTLATDQSSMLPGFASYLVGRLQWLVSAFEAGAVLIAPGQSVSLVSANTHHDSFHRKSYMLEP